ncbi:type I-E CRISPR-associated protein Cas5/CasD [Arthrobacter woluwensis]|uniref:type I-E CRISPR-associated protein Cas5/CasD n=1 Tax=Arthrobacter woluwensis TaxID=156980 RepID=UPI000D12D057|nr:type I-E CRISPR-associated protein Cas5/CasD [Arthrobacter woluwensis]PSS43028.1 type I-E CRISPR-associated protein Cas5/CasD [Arthrobacter woluwensis]
MAVLSLRLAGPLQAWGVDSRFVQRQTRQEPTKSGVLGLLAAAQGRRRTDPVEDLVGLKFGVRVDQPGRLIRDFQTARTLDGRSSMPLSYRYYLGDAVFLAAVEGPEPLLQGLKGAVANPAYPLYLGRRSCVPSGRICLGVSDEDLDSALRSQPWLAATWHRKRQRSRSVRLEIIRDALSPDEEGETLRDVPSSFSPENRQYGWRTVVRPEPHEVPNELGRLTEHDPLAELGGS